MAQTTSHTRLSSYSPFFASGLLTPHTPRYQRRGTFNSDMSEPWDDMSDSSHSRASSPIPLPDDSVMDVDVAEFLREISPNTRRSVTPTPQLQPAEETTPVPSPQSTKVAPTPQPRLRRRKSSLTQGTSPMHAIRSPSRSAGNALHLQMQLPASTRSRSGSVGGEARGMFGGGLSMATEGTSLMGRMRSGSCSSVNPQTAGSVPTVALKLRRPVRRVYTTPFPAPIAPPPNSPLPALPSFSSGDSFAANQKLRPANINLGLAANATACAIKSAPLSSARARGLSVSSSTLDGDENRIDEEMKEN